jgi:phospholipid/cholesterol/gamma-HCH transport system ATP-binding protein
VIQAEENAAAGPVIRLEEVSKAYQGRPVLSRASLEIARGETMVILGSSGSGKSVALRHINGLTKPDSGKVVVFGRDIVPLSEEELAPVRLRVSMLFQGGALFDSMPVGDNIAFPLVEHTDLPRAKIVATVAEKLELVGLPGIERKMPAELSGGMRKRVALARSIALDPEVVLFDEPTTGLDPVNAEKINELIAGLSRRLRATFVVVTHDIVSARAISTRLAFLNEGAFQFVGTFAEALESGPIGLLDFFRSQGIAATEHGAVASAALRSLSKGDA